MTIKIAGILGQKLPLQMVRRVQAPAIHAVSILSYRRFIPALAASAATDRRWQWWKWGSALLVGGTLLGMQKTVFAENSNSFVGRKGELEALRKALLEHKIIYLRGQAGIGKTQLAEEYKNENWNQYHHHFSVKGNPKTAINEVRDVLATKKNYLLIIDGVDEAEMAAQLSPLFRLKLNGDVIITGKYNSSFPNIHDTEVPAVGRMDAIDIFEKCLSSWNEENQKHLDKIKEEDKEQLISLLKLLEGSPALIKIAAKELDHLWRKSEGQKNLTGLIKEVSSLDPKVIHHLMLRVEISHDRSVEFVEECFKKCELKLAKEMIYDVLYFYAFHFAQDKVSLSKLNGKALNALFLAASKKFIKNENEDIPPSVYDRYKEEDILRAFAEVTSELINHGLLIKDEKGQLTMPLSFKWWVINQFYYKELDAISQEVRRIGENKQFADALERQKAKWLFHFITFLNETPVDIDDLIDFFKCVKKFNLSPQVRIEIAKELTEAVFKKVLSPQQQDRLADRFVKDDEVSSDYFFFEKIYQQAVKKDPFNPDYRKNLAIYLGKNQDFTGAEREERIANGLIEMEKVAKKRLKPISNEYKNLILNLLSSDKFKYDDWGRLYGVSQLWQGHTIDDGGILLGEILRFHPAIEELDLYGCHLSDEGLKKISQILSYNKSLKILRLDYNGLVTGEGVRALADALQKHPQIVEISLCHSSKIDAGAIGYLVNQAPDSLKKIHLTGTINEASQESLEQKAQTKRISLVYKR